MKKQLIACLVLLLALVCFVAAAQADDPLKVSMELSKNSFTEPQSITVSIKVSNVGEGDMPGAVTLYYPSGKQVEEFGAPVLSVGASQSWSGTWKVTQAQLEAGRITFKIKYSVYNDDGELISKTKNFSKAITYTGAVASIEVNRTITPTVAQKGQEVTVTYDIVNSGTVDVTDVTIKENSDISTKSGVIATVAAGEKASYTFTATMGSKDLTSKATITYKASGKTNTTSKEAATIKYGQVNLTASLAADKKGGTVGDTATLTLTLKNTGKTDYSGLKVTDASLGDVFTDVAVAAGETVTLTKNVTIDETRDYRFTVSGLDADGMDLSVITSLVTLTAVDPVEAIKLDVSLVTDKETVYQIPGTVRFTVTVTNNSAVDVSSVKIYCVNQLLHTFDSITAGASKTYTRDVAVSMAGTFQVEARVTNKLNETEVFGSNTQYIGYSEPTAVPTEAPIVTPPAPDYVEVPTEVEESATMKTVSDAAGVLAWVFGGLAAVCVLLLVIGLVRRSQAKAASDAALDHLDISSGPRDYEHENPDAPKQAESEASAPAEETDVSEDEQPSDIMEETLARIYSDPNHTPADPAVEVEEIPDSQPAGAAPAEENTEGSRRRHRHTEQ